ncbi:MAG: right-handed parallel beta-helix repeat-containing protein [Bacteroidales bacterium]|nr:right-handed parallel beta-helix repeat-containing protein [Bacteroidales bacterium]
MTTVRKCLMLASLLFPFLLQAQTLEVEGEVMGSWNADTVKVTGNIFLPAGASLFIEAGVVVEFQGFYGFKVDGSLQALGTAASPVIFTVNDTTGLHNVNAPGGGWSGIHMVAESEEDNITAIFDHCHFEYAKTWQEDSLPHGGAVYISGPANASFQHCSFLHNRTYLSGGAIYFNGASPLIENCYFSANLAGHEPPVEENYGYGGAVGGINTKAVIRGNVFFDNWSTGIGGGLSIDNGDPLIENNIFEGNDSPLGGGFGILRSQVLGTIANNLVANNYSIFFGGGIALIGVRANLANNTIVGNYAGYGGGLYFNLEAYVKVYNTIVWGNTAHGDYGGSVYIWDGPSVPDFYYCNIEGGQENFDGATFLGEYLHNIDLDPLFAAEGDHPWQLLPGSPCINAGTEDPAFLALPATDLPGNERIQLGRIDMGAYEADTMAATSITETGAPKLQLRVFPNPARETTKVALLVEKAGKMSLYLVNTRGQRLMMLHEGFLEPGRHEFIVNVTEALPGKGVYFIIGESLQEKVAAKVVVWP